MSDPDWREIAAQLYAVAKTAGCRCDYERNGMGVPTWYINPETNTLERKLVAECSRCKALAVYELAIK